jgi:hypothetical protein
MKPSEVTFGPPRTDAPLSVESFGKELSELGRRIWDAIRKDDQVDELLFELADAKLVQDRVKLEDTRLASDAADAIMGDPLMDAEGDPAAREAQRSAVPPSEWLKYSLYNLALDWVLDQALMRMKLEQKWPFQEDDGLTKP